MITLYLYFYKNAMQTPTPNAGFTRRLYSVHAARPQRAQGALEDPQRAVQHDVQTPSSGVNFQHGQNKHRRMGF